MNDLSLKHLMFWIGPHALKGGTMHTAEVCALLMLPLRSGAPPPLLLSSAAASILDEDENSRSAFVLGCNRQVGVAAGRW